MPPVIAAWLAKKGVGVAVRALRWVLILLAAFAPFWMTWRAGYQASEAKHAHAAAAAQMANLQWLLSGAERNAQLAGDYYLRRAETSVRYDTLIRRIHDVTTVYREAAAAPAQPLPVCMFTRGFVRVWDSASAGADAVPGTAGSVPAAAPTAAAAERDADAHW